MKLLPRIWLKREEVPDAHGLAVGAAQQQAGLELVLGEKPFQQEGRQFHVQAYLRSAR